MTNEEAAGRLRYITEANNPKNPNVVAVAMGLEALEAADKYRWHDLIKDPEDLPLVGYHHQIIFQWVGSDGCMWYDCGWFYTDEQEDEPYFSTHDVHMFIGDDFRHVTAWRYIEKPED